jgi:UDP-N-acetylglucosamine 2-epimerase (non-hydrolysing)
MKILVVLGTRPEVIKLAPVIQVLKEHMEVIVCATGQHREMLVQALEIFKINPDINLQVMSESQSLNNLSSKIIFSIDVALKIHRPDYVLVQGDTTSAFFAALAAFHLNIKVAHLEAGLRTQNLRNPFPEEANRAMIARIADIHFAPTQSAKAALLREGINSAQIIVTGNTIVDSIYMVKSQWINDKPKIIPDLIKNLTIKKSLILVTCHRRENFGDVIFNISHMIKKLAGKYREFQWILPVHLNPEVRRPIFEILKDIPNIHLIEPVDYETNLFLLSQSTLVLTDSGGIQEEAPSFGVPVIVMRSMSERMEGIHAGFAILAGQDANKIEMEVDSILKNQYKLSSKVNPYGDGKASQRIFNYFMGEKISEFNG